MSAHPAARTASGVRSEMTQAYPNCFGCGEKNPVGLHLTYRFEGDALVTNFTPEGTHEGWPGIVHGGIIAALLYEVMENFAFRKGIVTMMRDMDVQFRRPAHIGKNITALARLELSAEREMSVTGILVQDNTVAKGSARLVALSQEHIDRLGIGINATHHPATRHPSEEVDDGIG